MGCEHKDFEARVEVNRLHDREDAQDPHAFCAEVTVKCAQCGALFGFKGAAGVGVAPGAPTVDPLGTTLRVPLASPAELALMDGLPGFALSRGWS